MHVSIDPCVDAAVELGTVDDCPAYDRVLLVNCVDRAAEDPKRQLRVLERTDKSPEFRLLVDILLYILLKKRSALEIPFGILRFGRRREGNVPAKTKSLNDFVGVEIAMEHRLPDLHRKGRVSERFAEAVHVRRETCVMQRPGDSVNMISLDFRTSAPRHLVALARFRRASKIIGFMEFEPQAVIDTDLFRSLREALAVGVVVEFVGAVVRGKQDRKGEELVCQRVERLYLCSGSELVVGGVVGDIRETNLIVNLIRNGRIVGRGRTRIQLRAWPR